MDTWAGMIVPISTCDPIHGWCFNAEFVGGPWILGVQGLHGGGALMELERVCLSSQASSVLSRYLQG